MGRRMRGCLLHHGQRVLQVRQGSSAAVAEALQTGSPPWQQIRPGTLEAGECPWSGFQEVAHSSTSHSSPC